MRLRQAHAILEAVTALEACGLGFELHPLHHDFPGTPPHITCDSMSGYTEPAPTTTTSRHTSPSVSAPTRNACCTASTASR